MCGSLWINPQQSMERYTGGSYWPGCAFVLAEGHFSKSEIRGSSALMTAFLTEISFSSLETFNQVKHLLAE
jgi:hypothetical protein